MLVMTTMICQQCGSEFIYLRAQHKRRFCSQECYHKSHIGRDKKRITRLCEFCGKQFEIKLYEIDRARFCSCACRDKSLTLIYGKNHPSWQGGDVECRCEMCGASFYARRARVDHGVARFCSRHCYERYQAEYCIGDHAYNWKGGLSLEPYSPEFNKRTRRSVLKRDSGECLICGATDGRLAVHHIDYNKKNSDPSNLVILCQVCHPRTNWSRSYWQTRLSSFMGVMGYD